MTIWLLSSLWIQPRTSPLKFDHLVVKSEKGSISNLSTKVLALPGVAEYRADELFRGEPLHNRYSHYHRGWRP